MALGGVAMLGESGRKLVTAFKRILKKTIVWRAKQLKELSEKKKMLGGASQLPYVAKRKGSNLRGFSFQ